MTRCDKTREFGSQLADICHQTNKQASMRVNKHLECSTVRREMRVSGASDDWIKGERGIKMEIREEAKEPPSFHLRAFGDERWRRAYCILEWWKIKALRSQKYRWGGSDTYSWAGSDSILVWSQGCFSIFTGKDTKIFYNTSFFFSEYPLPLISMWWCSSR